MTGGRDLARAAKRLLWNHDSEMAFDAMLGIEAVVNLQRFICGKPANCAVACWEGEIIADIEVEVVASNGPTGQALVVRIVDNQDMLDAARRIVGHLGISGFCGFDFVLEEDTRNAYLIEINPRATQINHLVLRAGGDLVAMLRARVGGRPLRERPVTTERDTIALFPRAQAGGGESKLIADAYDDLPYGEQGLVDAYLARRRKPGGLSRGAAKER
jgi:hypothetical protein